MGGYVTMNYGRAIRVLRGGRGWSQLELAKKVKVNGSYLSLIEGGHREPSTEVVIALADALGVGLVLFMTLVCDERDLAEVSEATISALGAELLRALVAS